MTSGVVIVGAGHAGSQVAASLRQEGYDGPITLIGAEAEAPYHRPPLSKAFLKTPDAKPQPLRGDDFFAASGVTFLDGAVVQRIDVAAKTVALDDGSHRSYETLVIATGARPRWPAIPGADLEGVLAMRTIADARAIRERLAHVRSVVVIGGGFVGLETASTLLALGRTVTVLEIGPRLLGRAVSPVVSDHVLTRLSAQGADIRFGTAPIAITGDENGVRGVALSNGDTLPADLVLVGIGVEPECDLAAAAGIACDDGILIDHAMRTSAPNILAIGDCTRFHHWHADRPVRLESVQNATDQAKLAARTILGHDEPYRAVPWFWSDIGDMKLQMVGLSFDADAHVTVGAPADNAFSVYHFRAGTLIAIDSVNRPADHMTGRRIIASTFRPSENDAATGRVNELFKAWQAADGLQTRAAS
ncbi:FAD-dependent oxidoreductase [Mesorhizobium sp. CAU 1732]|uniref:NAD(P)/FAD-dependent oxidoreductase n=1 Tax=Mesorhizobium sp. CAU 1732 TaxID=3140358 RepID=UPI0032601911